VTDQKRPLDAALDLVVYAPLGFALEARRLLPTFVERGRNQVTMAKVVGKFAVDQGQAEAGKGVARVAERAEAVLAEFGLREDRTAPPDATAGAAPAAAEPAAAPTAQSGAGAATLAITDYDSLAASQGIPRLAGLSADELAEVARYESAHRGRRTILGKITQLQGG